MSRFGRVCVLGVASCVALLLCTESARPVYGSERDGDQCELGITLALLGRTASAESVFVSMLSRVPPDSRALTNLGNLALLRGDADLAVSFYEQALESDTADAGIKLDLASALTILGDEEDASALAAEGVRQAGGFRAAARLLAL